MHTNLAYLPALTGVVWMQLWTASLCIQEPVWLSLAQAQSHTIHCAAITVESQASVSANGMYQWVSVNLEETASLDPVNTCTGFSLETFSGDRWKQLLCGPPYHSLPLSLPSSFHLLSHLSPSSLPSLQPSFPFLFLLYLSFTLPASIFLSFPPSLFIYLSISPSLYLPLYLPPSLPPSLQLSPSCLSFSLSMTALAISSQPEIQILKLIWKKPGSCRDWESNKTPQWQMNHVDRTIK